MQSNSPLNFIMLPSRVFVSRILVIGAVLLLIVSVFRREFSTDGGERGMLALIDTSLSMSVEDIVSPTRIQLSRLDAVRELLSSPTGAYPRAIMTFADDARLQLPLSTDVTLWKETLSTLTPIRYGATTDIESALASVALIYTGAPLDIIIFTDGESTQDTATGGTVILPDEMSLTIVGIGTTAGGKIISNLDGEGLIVYKKYDGEEVVSRLDEDHIERLAQYYDGHVYYIRDTDDIASIQGVLMQQSPLTNTTPRLDIMILLASVLLLVGLMMRDYRTK